MPVYYGSYVSSESYFLSYFLSWPHRASTTKCKGWYSTNDSTGSAKDFQSSLSIPLCLALSVSVSAPLSSLIFFSNVSCLNYDICLLNSLRTLGFLWISLHYTSKLSPKWSNYRAHLIYFLFVRITLLVQYLKAVIFYILFIFLVLMVEGQTPPYQLILHGWKKTQSLIF